MALSRGSESPQGVQSLREAYMQASKTLIRFVLTSESANLSREDLPNNLVSFSQFDTQSSEYVTSDMCLFQPMSAETLRKYSVDLKLVEPGMDVDFGDYEPMTNPQTLEERVREDPFHRSIEIWQYLENMFVDLPRKELQGGTLEDKSGWTPVRYGNSFFGQIGVMDTSKMPGWSTREIWEHVSKHGIKSPHIITVTNHGANGTENELLLGDLAVIVQVIQNRLWQEDFANTSFFSVLVLSLFGPRHGRIIQGCFDSSGELRIQFTKSFSFLLREESPFDLFLRFLASEPREPSPL